MDAAKLVKMANQIATFFESDPDPKARHEGIAGHLRRFWDPRMRRAIYQHLDTHRGEGLKPSVLQVLETDRTALEPPAATP